jgi:hypothetical protein
VGKGIVLELKWPIDALTLSETLKIDNNVLDASLQLGKNRRLLRDGDAVPGGAPNSPTRAS